MTSRCHLCGREGTRGYLVALAVVLVNYRGVLRGGDHVTEEHVTICAARRACNQRRGVPA